MVKIDNTMIARAEIGIGIVELVTWWAAWERPTRLLSDQPGAWSTGADPPVGALARLVVEACHRHAAHAELWAGRRPTIPIEPTAPTVIEPRPPIDDRVRWYRAAITELRIDVGAVRSRVDVELDPSTLRTTTIVDADLADLVHRLETT